MPMGVKTPKKITPRITGLTTLFMQRAELHPGAVERRQPLRAGQGDDGEQAGQGEQPGSPGLLRQMPRRPTRTKKPVKVQPKERSDGSGRGVFMSRQP